MQDDSLQRFLVSRSRTDLEALVRGEHAWLLAIAQHVAHDPGLAEDAVQEVFVKLIESPPAAHVVQTSRGWLAACVIGAARTLLRGRVRREQRERVASRPEVLGDDRRDLDHDDVRAAVFELADPQRECVELRYFAGLSPDEIGRTLGCARRTVDERLANARDSLRKRLEPHAFALIAAGIQHETIVPRVTASREFIGRLERLLEHPSLVAHTAAAGASAIFVWFAGALVVSVGAFAVWSGTQRGTSSTSAVAAQSPNAQLEHDGQATNPGEQPSAPTSTRVATPSSADVTIVTSQTPSSVDLRIHVLDETGAHVQAGELRLEPVSLPSHAYLSLLGRDDLAQFAELLGPIQLAGRNPLEVRGLPSELARNTYVAYAIVPGFGSAKPEVFGLADGFLSETVLVVRRPRTVTISVEDRVTHRPLADATVVSISELERRDIGATSALRDHAPGAGVSDTLGMCTLDRLGSGEHVIEVHAAGHASTRATLAEDANQLALALDPAPNLASLIVDVTDPGNMPIAGAPVICRQVGRELDRRASTDAMGRCRFAELEPGSWDVMLDSLPYARLRMKNGWKGENESFGTAFELAAGENKRIQLGFLDGTVSWWIEVVDARGQPRSDIEVTVNGPVQRTAKTRANGSVLFERLPAGKWSFEVNGWSSNARELADDSSRTDRVELGTFRIRGRVKLGVTGAPAFGANVIASGDLYAMVACDKNGEFRLENAPNGTFLVDAGVPGLGSATATVQVKDADPPMLELTLGL